MKRGRHVEDVLPPRGALVRGEVRAALIQRGLIRDTTPCDHDEGRPWCSGGHGRHLAIPRHPVAWPSSSSQAGLASFRSAR